MGRFIKITAFSLIIIGLYTFYSVFVIPPINPGEPPSESAASGGPATIDELLALGEEVYNGKGACSLCHTKAGGRAPALDDSALVAKARFSSPGYSGKASDIESYLYESLVHPSAYVVPGYGVSGTEDRVSPMPDVRESSIGLNETEIRAVIAFLQSISGVEITVALPGEGREE
ncbi:MAG: hypothetical protein H3C68_08445 [Deltaproteobacteria bacterium]|nr:hypothetical protein [Deltaproteobacteria bacterium]MBZ0219397.1 hypothetical protein [Deltaproteobacteria bacterium]